MKPQNAVALVRLSDLRFEDLDEDGQAKGNVDQTQRIKTRARHLGWKVGRVIVENDLVRREDGTIKGVSAFKRRKVTLPNGRREWRTFRPGLRQAMELLVKGEHDGFIGLDLDRVFRDPRDLEDMIDIAEEYGIPVESVTGSLRLSNDADVTMARVMVAVANKESRDKSRRVSAARERQAQAGEYGGGRRPYGFDEDGVTIRKDECAVIADAAVRLVQGASLRSLALDLRTRKVPTVTGAAWSAETLRDILLRPRNAGFMVYQDEEIGDAPWKDDAPVPVETFRAVQRILTDPDRRVGPGAAPKWVGTNIYLCGICTDGKLTQRTGVHVRLGGRSPAYRCKEFNHLVRQVAHVDKLVIATVLGRLAKADAVDLLTPARPEVDVAGLRSEATAIRTNLNELAADKALGLIDRGQLITGTEKGKARLEQITAELQAAIVDSPLTPLIGAEDIEATWEGLGLSHQRLVIDALVNVRILPSGRKGRGFDPATVEITWKDAKPRRRRA